MSCTSPTDSTNIMKFELTPPDEREIQYTPAKVTFPGYRQYLEQATAIAEYIKSLNVTDENTKEVKDILARARKVTDALNRRRIDMRTALLEEYSTFEAQVKTLIGVVDDADAELRDKLRELENQQRLVKKEAIRGIWDKRIWQYPHISYLIREPFDRWFTDRMLNKTMSMKAVEENMTLWMERVEKESESAKSMGDEYLAEYVTTLDLVKAITNVKEREEVKAKVKQQNHDDTEESATFIITGAKDITFTEMLLNKNEINYRRI